MSAMAVVIQAMVWMGMPQPPALYLVLYMLCIGMYGAGVGMLYTPILVDRLNLVYPSGLAVANILRALTDPELLKRSVAMLGGGMLTWLCSPAWAPHSRLAWATGLSMSTVGRRDGGGRARRRAGTDRRPGGQGADRRTSSALAGCERVSRFARSPF